MRLILASPQLLLLLLAYATAQLSESGEYQEMDMGTEVVGLGLDDGDELEYMEITDLAIADDLATCSRSAWQRVNRRDSGTLTGSMTVDLNSGNPGTTTLTGACGPSPSNVFTKLTGTRIHRGRIIDNEEDYGHLNCDNATVTFQGTGERATTTEVWDLRSKSTVSASRGDYQLSSSVSGKIKGGDRYTKRDVIQNGNLVGTTPTVTGYSIATLCSPGRRKTVDFFNSTSYACALSALKNNNSVNEFSWSITSPLRGIPIMSFNAFLNFTKPVGWDPLIAPKGAGKLTLPTVDSNSKDRVMITNLKLGSFGPRLDNQAVVGGSIGPFYLPKGQTLNATLILQYGATTAACRRNVTFVIPP